MRLRCIASIGKAVQCHPITGYNSFHALLNTVLSIHSCQQHPKTPDANTPTVIVTQSSSWPQSMAPSIDFSEGVPSATTGSNPHSVSAPFPYLYLRGNDETKSLIPWKLWNQPPISDPALTVLFPASNIGFEPRQLVVELVYPVMPALVIGDSGNNSGCDSSGHCSAR